MDGGDVGVVETGEDLSLPLEPGQPIRIVCEGVGQDLQGDLAAKLGVSRLPDLAHAAFAKEGGHVVVPEAGADAEGHELLGSRSELFYAEAVHGSSFRLRYDPRTACTRARKSFGCSSGHVRNARSPPRRGSRSRLEP